MLKFHSKAKASENLKPCFVFEDAHTNSNTVENYVQQGTMPEF